MGVRPRWAMRGHGGQLRIDEYEFWTDGLQHVLSLRGYRRSRKAVSGFRMVTLRARRKRVDQKRLGGEASQLDLVRRSGSTSCSLECCRSAWAFMGSSMEESNDPSRLVRRCR